MHILIVQARVKAEFIDAFKQATAINAENSAKEPGVARFDLLQQQDDGQRFVLYEVYRDASAPAKHKETAHYKAWVEQVSHMFEEPRTRALYSNVCPTDEAW
jgi:autoinducer 2-degrading protein